ncbi:4'-phosphopantetheinyl transferase superfamily protein (plasmid) [Rhizobium sp. NIBRBAC000502774]|nr:4'-phosphopantetheinyl transferase superfamily protein [Rhizobium sp. NIBRBAC000502774]
MLKPVLLHDEIEIWLVDHDRLAPLAVLDRYRQILSKEEITQERKFRSQTDRLGYAVTRIAQRLLLSRYVGMDPEALTFSRTSHGRPGLSCPPAERCGLDFNISHDGTLTVFGLIKGGAIGVDVMTTPARSSYMNVARRFFCPVETEALDKLAEPLRARRFMEFWTLKEAYVKACGAGLSIPLNSFYFVLEEPGKIDFFPQSPSHDISISWNFWQFRPAPEVLIAICVRQESVPGSSVNLREFHPFKPENLIACSPHRISRKHFSRLPTPSANTRVARHADGP